MSNNDERSGFDSDPRDYDKNGFIKPGAARAYRRSTNPNAGSTKRSEYSGGYNGTEGVRGPPSHYHPDGSKKSGLD